MTVRMSCQQCGVVYKKSPSKAIRSRYCSRGCKAVALRVATYPDRKAYLFEWRRNADPEKIKAAHAAWRTENKERIRAYYVAAKEKSRPRLAATAARHRALRLQATPIWTNKFFVDEAYELARLRTEVTGFRWHVDHIVPLQSPLVCGLHTEFNLQVIPAFNNRSKSNRHWPNMP